MKVENRHMSKREALIDLIGSIPEHKIRTVYDKFLPILQENMDKEHDAITIVCCPHCGSISIKKNGTKDGKQRFLCNDCKKSFSVTTNTFFFHNRIPEEIWKRFIDYELNGVVLREEAYLLDLSITTCFRMRHKLHRAISTIVEKERLNGDVVQVDANYQKINLKGTRPENMPRFSKRRGSRASYRGISHHKVCVVSAIDINDNMFLKIVGLGAESINKYTMCKYKFEQPQIIVSDSKSCMQQFANELGATLDAIPTKPNEKRYTTANGNHLGELNQLHSEISSLITKTHGVSTRFFQDYLNFITYIKKVKYQIEREDLTEFIFNEIKNTPAFTQEELYFTELPISLKEAYYEYRYGIFA